MGLKPREKRAFFQKCLCNDIEIFKKQENLSPLCLVFMSQTECVGKSHVIRQIAENNNYKLIHVPINTKKINYQFVVDRLWSADNDENKNDNDDNKNDDKEQKQIVFHIDIS